VCGVQFLFKLVPLFRAYFGGKFDESSIRNNFVLIYELLDGTHTYTRTHTHAHTHTHTHSHSLVLPQKSWIMDTRKSQLLTYSPLTLK